MYVFQEAGEMPTQVASLFPRRKQPINPIEDSSMRNVVVVEVPVSAVPKEFSRVFSAMLTDWSWQPVRLVAIVGPSPTGQIEKGIVFEPRPMTPMAARVNTVLDPEVGKAVPPRIGSKDAHAEVQIAVPDPPE